ncbi:MAG: diguanylate cyclase [Candidatus Accumulibacter sp.]|uniref:diguanylate cyclase domain-containing protein n=1 Tax=Accumulibacter sp. TaxID=2053492 RepID=UPI0028793E3C|nr:diguanylate cyclase [Accumulibacter sp.]MDS4015213.1 diguanylate cyclase [Accumulibacter sp.]
MPVVRLLFLLLALLAAAASGGVWAQAAQLTSATTTLSLRPFIEVLEDPNGSLDIADVERPELAARFQPVAGRGEANFGYSDATYWLRLRLLPPPGAPSSWLLEVGHPALDQVTLFFRHNSGFTRLDAGDRAPFAARPYAHRNFVFPISLSPGGEQSLYLRVVSAGNVRVPLTLWSPQALLASDQASYSLLAAYLGMLLALALYHLLPGCTQRDLVSLAFVAFLVAWLFSELSTLGLGSQYLWSEWPEWANIAPTVSLCVSGIAGAALARAFLATRRTAPGLDRMLQWEQVGFIVAALAAISEAYRVAEVGVILLSTAVAATTLIGAILGCSRRQPGAGLFLIAWIIHLLGVATVALGEAGLLPGNLITQYGGQIGSAVQALLLSFAIAARTLAVRQEMDLAHDEMLRAKEQAMETLQQSEKTLEQRVMQRTLELAEANDRLRQSEAELRKLAHHDPLTGLANRALLFEELRRVLARAKRSGEMVALLMIDLDGFKPVNDSYGHAVGDHLLEIIATRLQDCVRVSDTVARLGGDEFVVVVEAVLDSKQAMTIGAKIIANLSQPALVGQHSLQVGASVGVALWPLHAEDIHHLLQAADRAMYLAKEDGRGRCSLATPPGQIHQVPLAGKRLAR